MRQQFVIKQTGQVVTLDVAPGDRLDAIEIPAVFTGEEGEPRELTVRDADGLEHLVPATGLDLEPLTHDPKRWRLFHLDTPDGEPRVFDTSRWPTAGQDREGVLLFWPDAGRMAWEGGGLAKRDGALRLHSEPKRLEDIGLIVRNYAVAHFKSGKPFAHSLPRRKVKDGKLDTLGGEPVVRYSDGNLSDLKGRPAIRNRAEYENERARTGMERD